MRVQTILTASAAASLLLAVPAFAQDTITKKSFNTETNTENTLKIKDSFNTDYNLKVKDSYNSEGNNVGSNVITANQELKAVNANHDMDHLMNFEGDTSNASAGYASGSQSVNNNAYAAFAGISNAAWNTGVDSNAQAASNIAAQGTINFGATSGAGTGKE